MANITPELVGERIKRFGKLYMIDDLIRERARDEEQVPILGYPKHRDSAAEYEFFTGKDLDRMVDEACRAFVRKGWEVNAKKTVALYAQSDLSFVVTFFALFRLGYKVLTVSIRLGSPACLALLDRAGCDTILRGSTARIDSTLVEVAAARPDIKLVPMLAREEFDRLGAPAQEPFRRPIHDVEAEHTEVALMMHSSGSTGLPKPLVLSHRSLLNALVSGTGLKAFNALPWYHLHGLITSIQAMWMRRTAHLYNPHLPLTAAHLVAALRTIRPEICHTVPYALKLIAEEPEGVEVLKQCRYVTSAGAKTPDELGDRLVKQGVNLGLIFGLTEVGHMGDSIRREPGDDSWAYIRPFANLKDHMFFKHLEGSTYESVYLESHPALMTSNSDDPPNSFHSKDLFEPHPTIPNAWKYVARHDDRITLLNGEKILPLAMEGAVRENPLVRDALMVGLDRPVPGMLVFRAQAAADMSEEDYLDAIWPSVEEANRIADEFARITPETIASVPAGVDFPATDKNNIIRAAAYRVFAAEIDRLYERLEGGGARSNVANGDTTTEANGAAAQPLLALDVPALEKYIMDTFASHTGITLPDTEADFFASGVDSLRAIQARRLFQMSLDLGGRALPTNVVYDAGNAAKLARVLHDMRVGGGAETNGAAAAAPLSNGSPAKTKKQGSNSSSDNDEEQLAVMERLIEKYSSFTRVPGSTPNPAEESVVLTGATGALGAHVLDQLLRDSTVGRVTCLVRGPNGPGRVRASLAARGLALPPAAEEKLAVWETSNLGAADLGLGAEQYAELQAGTTLVVHAAWPVHFHLSAASFEPHVAGLRNLLQLALGVPFERPARLLFASSISAAFNTPPVPPEGSSKTIPIAEAPIPSLAHAAGTGYARSKLVGERVCEAAAAVAAAAGAPGTVGVLRIGQITGDTSRGIWNDREAVPLMIRSALEVGALPLLSGGDRARCEWIPVDVVAATCLDLARALKEKQRQSLSPQTNGNGTAATNGVNGTSKPKPKPTPKAHYYNLSPPHAFSWNEAALPALRAAGLAFEAVPLPAWLARLRTRADELGAEAAGTRLPAFKLADYFAQTYGGSDGDERDIRFEIEAACRDSPSLKTCPNVAEAGLVGKYLASWLKVWSS